jgi:hypothetical protein
MLVSSIQTSQLLRPVTLTMPFAHKIRSRSPRIRQSHLVYQSSLAPMRSTRGGTMASGRRNELPELQLVF